MINATPTGEQSAAGTEGIAALFVRRPVLSLVLSMLIILAGLAATAGVEIRELPSVDNPVVTVTTNFTGAAAETIDREVTAVVEAAAGRVSGVKNISSTSSFGRSRITADFQNTVDINVAASDMRDALARVAGDLPADADDPQVVKADSDAQPVLR